MAVLKTPEFWSIRVHSPETRNSKIGVVVDDILVALQKLESEGLKVWGAKRQGTVHLVHHAPIKVQRFWRLTARVREQGFGRTDSIGIVAPSAQDCILSARTVLPWDADILSVTHVGGVDFMESEV